MKELGILLHNFFAYLDFWCMLAPQWWRNVHLMNLIVYIPEMSFSYLQNLSIFFPSGKYIQFVPFCSIATFPWFHLLIHSFHTPPYTPIINTPYSLESRIKEYWVAVKNQQFIFFIITFNISISIFFSCVMKCIPLNIRKILKRKFRHMRW